MSADASIYNISHKLLDLMARYADLQEELVCTPEQAEATGKAIEDLDKEIALFLGSELVKDRIDGVSGFLLMAKGRAKEARAEAARLTRMADSWEHREKRLKGYLQNVMENAGLKRLEGRNSIMRIQANGGVQPLVISQPDLVPDECCTWMAAIPFPVWCSIKAVPMLGGIMAKLATRTPSNALIREALIQPCPTCGEMENYGEAPGGTCPECHGSRRASVPGAHLEQKNSHLRVA